MRSGQADCLEHGAREFPCDSPCSAGEMSWAQKPQAGNGDLTAAISGGLEGNLPGAVWGQLDPGD